MRWGWLEKNPVTLVRCSSKRLRRPDILTAEEFRALLGALPDRERLMGTICATTGLRIGEVLGLKWEDIDFTTHLANVLRSYSDGAIGPCKTEISEQPVPLDEIVIEELLAWHPAVAIPSPETGSSPVTITSARLPCGPTACGRRFSSRSPAG
jgi:integrase